MQVTSLKLSKKLTELGVEVGTYLRWCYSDVYNDSYIISVGEYSKKPFRHESICAAFTLDEILEPLPNIILDGKESPKTPYELYMRKWQEIEGCGFGFSYVYFQSCFKSEIFIGFHDKNPAEAAGRLLVWCIENGYVETGKKEKENASN
jgi:hypothetical protein